MLLVFFKDFLMGEGMVVLLVIAFFDLNLVVGALFENGLKDAWLRVHRA
jgi:hypothetical protein